MRAGMRLVVRRTAYAHVSLVDQSGGTSRRPSAVFTVNICLSTAPRSAAPLPPNPRVQIARRLCHVVRDHRVDGVNFVATASFL